MKKTQHIAATALLALTMINGFAPQAYALGPDSFASANVVSSVQIDVSKKVNYIEGLTNLASNIEIPMDEVLGSNLSGVYKDPLKPNEILVLTFNGTDNEKVKLDMEATGMDYGEYRSFIENSNSVGKDSISFHPLSSVGFERTEVDYNVVNISSNEVDYFKDKFTEKGASQEAVDAVPEFVFYHEYSHTINEQENILIDNEYALLNEMIDNPDELEKVIGDINSPILKGVNKARTKMENDSDAKGLLFTGKSLIAKKGEEKGVAVFNEVAYQVMLIREKGVEDHVEFAKGLQEVFPEYSFSSSYFTKYSIEAVTQYINNDPGKVAAMDNEQASKEISEITKKVLEQPSVQSNVYTLEGNEESKHFNQADEDAFKAKYLGVSSYTVANTQVVDSDSSANYVDGMSY